MCTDAYIVNLLAPIIVFWTTIWVITRLAKRSEIISLLSHVISLHRIITPYVSIALLLTGVNFYLTGWLLATTNKARIEFETKYLNMGPFVRSDYIQHKVGPDQYLHITKSKYHSYKNTGYDVSLDTFKDNVLIERLHAEKIQWHATDQTWNLRSWQKRVLFPRHEELTAGDPLTIALAVHQEDFAINPNLKDGLTLPELDTHSKIDL